MKLNRRNSQRALTLIEALIIIAVIALLLAVLLPALQKAGGGPAPQCVNNLKRIGRAFHAWSVDYDGQFPMDVPTSNGGTKEFSSGKDTYRHFLALSNHLITPKKLLCPVDRREQVTIATVFGKAGEGQVPFVGNRNLSYFAGLDAGQDRPASFLSGDHHLTNNISASNGVIGLRADSPAGWAKALGDDNCNRWFCHNKWGNILLADGSVQSWNSAQLRNGLATTGVPTNRLALPLD